jgi:hypothetical protein
MLVRIFDCQKGKHFRHRYQLKSGGDCTSRYALERVELADCSLFHENPKMYKQPFICEKTMSAWMWVREREPSKDKLEGRGLSLGKYHFL